MVEVFKTNVQDPLYAHQLLEQIHRQHPNYRANFDLQDCDRILRVCVVQGTIDVAALIALLDQAGCQATPLSDEPLIPSAQNLRLLYW